MVTMNGSVIGTVDGLDKGIGASGLAFASKVIKTRGAPDGLVTSGYVSGLCLDVANNELYMAKTATGSTWFRLISGT